MRQFFGIMVILIGTAAGISADPAVDGKVTASEYVHSQKLLGGSLELSWQVDASGGLFVAVSAKTNGWVAVGLGTHVMDGAVIYIGSVGADGKVSYSEDIGKGHGHSPAPVKRADAYAVASDGTWTTVEVHVPGDSMVTHDKQLPFIVAYAGTKNIGWWHGLFTHASGTMDLS